MAIPIRGSEEDEIPTRQPKLLTIDIETSPNLAYVWSLWDENIPLARLIESTDILCFAAKWYGTNKVEFYSQRDHGKETMVKEAHTLIDEADYLIHYNGKRFDYPHLCREFLLAKLPPPSPTTHIDLLQVVRQRFKFASNKLDHVAKELGVGTKVHKSVDFDLWTGCMNDDPKAWEIMERYNKQDVRLTEKVFDELRGWLGSLINIGLFTGKEGTCTGCGSDHTQKRGPRYKGKKLVQQWVCMDCGQWWTDDRALAKVTTAGII